jgi:hypothetical protein
MAKLGDKVKDSITGFMGIVTGASQWLYGCERLFVEPQEMHEGKPVEGQWFDVQRLDVLVKTTAEPAPLSGGPQKDPRR